MALSYIMDFCKYCNDMLKITKNKHYKTNAAIDISVEEMTNLLLEQYKSEANSYYNGENTYAVNFNAKQLMMTNIDEIKKMFPNKSEIEIRTDLNSLYDDVVKDSKDSNQFNLTCNTCSVSYHMRPDTLLDSINFVTTTSNTDESAEIRFHDPTLFRTKNFICPNKNCITRTDMSDKVQKNKEAVFYKPNTRSHSVKYICKDCKSCLKT